MSLISLQFALFVLISVIVYYLFPARRRWWVLLAASYAYYLIICNKYIIYMLVTTVSTYLGARLIAAGYEKQKRVLKEHKEEWNRAERKAYKKRVTDRCRIVMIAVLVLNFGILGFLKYSGFAADTAAALVGLFGLKVTFPKPDLLLPLGISFYTFQTMGYLIDVYQEQAKAEKNFGKLALFVSFFPQIIQGPIAMYSDLAQQLYEPHRFSVGRLKSSAQLILWGIFKKMVIADRAAAVIKVITADSASFSGTFVLFAAVLYALQLYADFSGGIDIVRGIGELFGIQMAENFKRPYFAKSLTEYWHRWHITLGDWVRKYVFYPLSISRRFLNLGKKMQKTCGRHLAKVIPTSLASLITFLIIGIWHGANAKYVAFGLWNGAVIMLLEIFKPLYRRVGDALHVNRNGKPYRAAAILWTFLLVLVGYYFDIAQNLSDALSMLWRSVSDLHWSDLRNAGCLSASGLDRWDYLILIFCAAFLFIISWIQEHHAESMRTLLQRRSQALQWIVWLGGMAVILIFGYYGPHMTPADFVYMQF